MTQTVQVTDHTPIPWRVKLNPIWWLQCGGVGSTFTAPTVNNGAPYLPTIKTQWLRNLLWFFRNPCGNFVGFVIGLEDVNYSVTGSDNVLATTGRDCAPPVYGWRWAVLNKCFPFVNYYNGSVEFYLGWRPASGGFGLKLVFPS